MDWPGGNPQKGPLEESIVIIYTFLLPSVNITKKYIVYLFFLPLFLVINLCH